jgi:hypothetical protein
LLRAAVESGWLVGCWNGVFGDVLEVFADAFGKNDLERHGLNSSRNSDQFYDCVDNPAQLKRGFFMLPQLESHVCFCYIARVIHHAD